MWLLICGNTAQVSRVEEEMNGAFLTREGRLITASMVVAAELAGYLWDEDRREWVKDGESERAWGVA